MGKKQYYGEPTKTIGINIPISKETELREKFENILKTYRTDYTEKPCCEHCEESPNEPCPDKKFNDYEVKTKPATKTVMFINEASEITPEMVQKLKAKKASNSAAKKPKKPNFETQNNLKTEILNQKPENCTCKINEFGLRQRGKNCKKFHQ